MYIPMMPRDDVRTLETNSITLLLLFFFFSFSLFIFLILILHFQSLKSYFWLTDNHNNAMTMMFREILNTDR